MGKKTEENIFLKTIFKYVGNDIHTVLTMSTVLFGFVEIFLQFIYAINYTQSCSEFYGIDKKYFNGNEMFFTTVFKTVALTLLVIAPWIYHSLLKANESFKWKILEVIGVAGLCLLLVLQCVNNLLSIQDLNISQLLLNNIGLYMSISICIILTYFITLRDEVWKNKHLFLPEKVVLVSTLFIYLLIAVSAIGLSENNNIRYKRSYEIIDNRKAVLMLYKEKFLVMDCTINNNELIIKRGSYSFIEMNDVKIEYHKYDKVSVE